MKTVVCLKYFVHDCLWKQFFASNSALVPSNFICLTIFEKDSKTFNPVLT